MIPGLGGMNPKKMQAIMKQMGINQEDINATKVTIETSEKDIIISNPLVQKVTMQGQESFQISGDITESTASEITNDDIKLVMEKTKCSEEEAKATLDETKDIADAIIKLSNK